jgi:hypothetical protein
MTNPLTKRRSEKLADDVKDWKHERYSEYMVELARRNPCAGVVREPRAYFDQITLLANQQPAYAHAGCFANGEKYPVRITHLTAAIVPSYDNSPVVGTDASVIQSAALRLEMGDAYYQAGTFQALPLWHNKVATGSVPLGRGAVSFVFDAPVILPTRDAIEVRVALRETPTAARRVEVAFEGLGVLSQRPYTFSGFVSLDGTAPTAIDIDRFRNNASEPVALTDMVVFGGAEADDPTGEGDVRVVEVNCRVVGNGTQADFFQGPSLADFALPRIPAMLLGKTTGRAVVHRFAGDGLLLLPGSKVEAQAIALNSDAVGVQLGLALHGTLEVL